MVYSHMQLTLEFTDGYRLSWVPIVLNHTGYGTWEEMETHCRYQIVPKHPWPESGVFLQGSGVKYHQEVVNPSQDKLINLEAHDCHRC